MSDANKQPTNPIYNFFHTLHIKDLLAEKKMQVVSVTSADSVERTVKILSTNKILSAPVVDTINGVATCVGFIDVLDILKYITKAAPDDNSLAQNELQSLKIAGRAISLMSIGQIVDFSQRDPLIAVQINDTASSLVPYFARGFHRAAVFDKEKLVGVISQSDLVRAVAKELPMGKLKDIGATSLKNLGYAEAQTFTVKKTATVIQALRLMADNGVGQVAVVEDNGRLFANLSASDLRGLYQQDYPRLLDTVADYLQAQSPNSLSPICGLPSSTLLDVVTELVKSNLHHLWVLGDEFKPTSIITMTDVMKIAMSQ